MIIEDAKAASAISKREQNKQERRKAIIVVAERLFAEHGFAETSMSEISAQLGGSKGTLWSYFASKEELFTAVLDERTRAFRSELAALLEPTSDLHATLHEFCARFIAKLVEPQVIAMSCIVIAECRRDPALGALLHDRGHRMTHTLIAGYLRAHIDSGHLRDVDPEQAARTLVTLCQGAGQLPMLWRRTLPENFDPQTAADNVLDIFMRAYGNS